MEWMLMPFRRYADFSGRSRRMEFWMWQLLQVIVYVGVLLLAVVLGGGAIMTGDPAAIATGGGVMLLILGLYLIYCLAIFIPSIAVAVRRLHDTNRTGWWVLAPLAPYLVMLLAGAMVAGSPDMAGVAGILALVSMIAVFALAITLFVFYVLEGTKGPNKYGADPKAPNSGEVFA